MRLGMHMRELWEHKLGFALALALALLAAGRVYGFNLFPPGPEQSAGSGRAVTHVLVDTPQSSTVDLRQNLYDLEGLINRARLISNAMAAPGARERIASRAGVPVDAITTITPLNAEYADSGGPQGVEGISEASQYRLEIVANPTVPVIDINTEAPTQGAALKLADATAGGLNSQLTAIVRSQATPRDSRIELVQLGRAQPVATGRGGGPVLALLVFALVFAVAAPMVLFAVRVRRGWRLSNDTLGPDPAS
jgi:hypothetical protein